MVVARAVEEYYGSSDAMSFGVCVLEPIVSIAWDHLSAH